MMSSKLSLDSLMSASPEADDPDDFGLDHAHFETFDTKIDTGKKPSSKNEGRRLRGVDQSLSKGKYSGKKASRNAFFEQETHDLDAMSSSDEEEDDFNEEENDFESELEEDEETSDEEDNEEKGQTMTAMLATGMGEDDLEAEKKKIEDELKEIQIEEKLQVEKLKSSQQSEEKKAVHAKNQKTLWRRSIDSRVLLHPALQAANCLPHHDTLSFFKKDEGIVDALDEGIKEAEDLLKELIQFRRTMSKDRKDIGDLGPVDELDDAAPNNLWKMAKSSNSRFQKFKLDSIDKWSAKVALATGTNQKEFKALSKSTNDQIESVLNDRERVLTRSRLKRGSYTVLGQTKSRMKVTQDRAGRDLFDHHDNEVYDDSDFHHILVKEAVESTVASAATHDPLQATQEWLAAEKLKTKTRKKVDRKGSKGRRVNYDVIPKLVGFATPIPRPEVPGRDIYIASLFKS